MADRQSVLAALAGLDGSHVYSTGAAWDAPVHEDEPRLERPWISHHDWACRSKSLAMSCSGVALRMCQAAASGPPTGWAVAADCGASWRGGRADVSRPASCVRWI